MVKDSRKYASTGGWGFAHFDDGKPADEAVQNLLFLPRDRQSSRLCLPPLRTLKGPTDVSAIAGRGEDAMAFTITVNDQTHSVDVDGDAPRLWGLAMCWDPAYASGRREETLHSLVQQRV
jgi:hypothetical protein